jgi:signal transduction histidine kinase
MPLNETQIAGQTLYRDILGKPAFLLQVNIPREIYRQGLSSVRVLMLALLLTGLVFGGMMLFLLQRLILSRLSHLNRNIQTIGATRNLSTRVAVKGNDELTDLARSINGMLEQLTEYQGKLRSLTSQLSLTEERERRRLAVNLHDTIGQALAVLKIKVGTMRKRLPKEAADMMKEIMGLLEQAIQYTRTLTFELSPPILYDLGFEPAVEWLLEQFHTTHGLQITFEKDSTEKLLNDDIRIVLFQAVRELLMNVVKHARSPQVMVRSECTGETIHVMVKDEGVGFDFSAVGRNGTFGLFSVRERLDMLGGTLEILSSPGQGTHAVITAPIRKKENPAISG